MVTSMWGRLLLASACIVVSQNAWAQQQCSQRSQVVEHLAKKYQEAQVAVGVTGKGALVEVLTTKDGNTWSILLTKPDGVSCLVASGEGWRIREHDASKLDPTT